MSSKNKAAVALGKNGGKAKSEAKALSSKANGAKGGRPKKTVPVPPLPTTLPDTKTIEGPSVVIESSALLGVFVSFPK
jgi:hypothetical protein